MKKKFLFVFALLSVLTISGCNEGNKKQGTLSAPQEITVQSDGSKSLIIFDEVENADYYNIYINDMAITVKASGSGIIQFDASKIITLPQVYTIKIKAGGDDYFDSKFSKTYEYNHTKVLEAPIISIDGTTLNWNKIENASFYDVLVTTSNPMVETVHRFSTNKFNFSNLLVNKGEYLFKVRAVSEGGEYLPSIYSNQVKYTNVINLITPYNLSTNYDLDSKEMLLSFVSSENVNEFTLNINNVNYSISRDELNKFLYSDDLNNVYIIKLNSFAQAKGIEIKNSRVMNISVKANSTDQYTKSSQFSAEASCEFKTVLSAPEISVSKSNGNCIINISSKESTYLSGHAIYLNDRKYKTLSKDIVQIELPLDVVGSAGIRVQAISNNNNCYSSQLSDVRYATTNASTLSNFNVTINNGVVAWSAIQDATTYYIELSNEIYRHGEFIQATSFDMSTVCVPGKYGVKIIAIADGYNQNEKFATAEYSHQLSEVKNLSISTLSESSYLYFDEVDESYGYTIYLNNVMVNRLFTSSPININPYINSANGYDIKVKAINPINKYVKDSTMSAGKELQNIKTLSAPTLTIVKGGNNYYLDINVDENESALASSYEVWINYISIGKQAFRDGRIDITSYFSNAGQYSFMVKAVAVESNQYVKDSNISSIIYTCTKQLDTVTDINVTKIEDEGTYILTFKEQTSAAKYLVNIVRADDSGYNIEFELSSGVADISEYVKENGVYKIYVKALALEDSFYTDSATSGNPYRLTKGATLSPVESIAINKRAVDVSNGEIDVTWNKVENSIGYQVYVYYNQFGANVLKKSIFVPQSNNPSLNIGAGDNKCINKEGLYTMQIKALGDGEAYITSQVASVPYTYTMQTSIDFENNEIFMYGNTYTYKVNDINTLKNLLWYHYLYNNDVWKYNTYDYNLKIYCEKDLDALAGEVSDALASEVEALTSNVEKMSVIAKTLLRQYPEIGAWSYGAGDSSKFCLNEERGIYIFRYEDVLEDDKTAAINPTKQLYMDKLDVVDTFEQRSSNYVFAIDSKQGVDVTTTEQLFMAIQYNKKPNFVGDCDIAKAVYENARFILRQICSDNMSEYEKVLQIYDFLTRRVIYNYPNVSIGNASGEVTLSDGSTTMRGNVKDFYLEGILYNSNSVTGLFNSLNEFVAQSAVCDGLAKTMVVLCGIEGIDCIKVEGNTPAGGHAWNKVYIDIEEDGYEGKQWYVIDLASAINYKATISSTEYQVGLHKYFLITDDMLKNYVGAQPSEWHARLGEVADYKAETVFDYYKYQKYSCKFNGSSLVSNKTFSATSDNDVKDALMYAMLKANKKHRVIIDIEAENYITTNGATTVASRITNAIYESAREELGNQHLCKVTATIIDGKYIVLSIESVNYGA